MERAPRRVPCVGAVVHDDEGRLLLVARRNPPAAGRWSVPGGRVEPGETDHAAAAREVLEETGLTVRVDRLLGEVEIPADDGSGAPRSGADDPPSPAPAHDADKAGETGAPRRAADAGEGAADVLFVVADYACTVTGGRLRAGDDATDVLWADRTTFGRLDLVDGLHDALAAWDALPR